MNLYLEDGITKVDGTPIHNINGRGFSIGQ